MSAYEEVKSVVTGILGIDDGELGPETDLFKDLGADSLAIVEIVGILEEKYNLEITDDELEELNSLEKIVEYIDSRVKAAS